MRRAKNFYRITSKRIVIIIVLTILLNSLRLLIVERQVSAPEHQGDATDLHESEASDSGSFGEMVTFDESYGAMGKPVILNLTMEEEEIRQKLYKMRDIDQYVSDLIPLNRSLPDTRPSVCLREKYDYDLLPKASVIIVFHNEARSILLRTVHSVVNRSPSKLIHEIILVDDYSDQEDLKDTLDKYVMETWNGLVRVIRSDKWQGLIRARLMGAEAATGSVLVYLDCHCECTTGWLPPLLKPIQESRTTVVVPVIPWINKTTFEFKLDEKDPLVGFGWLLLMGWVYRSYNADATTRDSPAMAGGLFAIDKGYFEELGRYDDKMLYWGAENMELSFKIWMCGGRIIMHRCSIVGHVYRVSQLQWMGPENPVLMNKIRVAAVWMDEYEKIFLQRVGLHRNSSFYMNAVKDIQDRIDLRKRLNCRNFSWYIDNVFPERKQVELALYWGELKCDNFCLDSFGLNTAYRCHGLRGRQVIRFCVDQKIHFVQTCLQVHKSRFSRVLCEEATSLWTYNNVTKQLSLKGSDLCMTLSGGSGDTRKIILSKCGSTRLQKWTFQYWL